MPCILFQYFLIILIRRQKRSDTHLSVAFALSLQSAIHIASDRTVGAQAFSYTENLL